jgi:guanylate kinase
VPDDPKVMVVTGPSGVGKGTIINRILEDHPEYVLSISATTREPREGEVHGTDYYFLSRDVFQERVDKGEFLEYAEYAGNLYGTPRAELDRMVKALVLEIEIKGALQVRETLPEALQVFILPPSFETLRERLVGRGTDKPEVIERRLARAREELDEAEREAAHFGNRIVNDDLEESVRELEALVAKVWGRDFEGATE